MKMNKIVRIVALFTLGVFISLVCITVGAPV